MGWFSDDAKAIGTTIDSVGGAITNTIDSINYALSGDLPPETRVKLEEIKLKMQNTEAKIMDGQVQINKIEASSSNIFKSGWRPAIGWIGVLGLFYHFIIYPILEWYILIKQLTVKNADGISVLMEAPNLDSDGLMSLVLGMLGIGVMRSFEKTKGITK